MMLCKHNKKSKAYIVNYKLYHVISFSSGNHGYSSLCQFAGNITACHGHIESARDDPQEAPRKDVSILSSLILGSHWCIWHQGKQQSDWSAFSCQIDKAIGSIMIRHVHAYYNVFFLLWTPLKILIRHYGIMSHSVIRGVVFRYIQIPLGITVEIHEVPQNHGLPIYHHL